MTPKSECCLCNPDFGGDSVCDECKDHAAGYDDMRLRMECVGRALRRILKSLPADDISLLRYELEVQVEQNCAPELAQGDARDARIERWRREADAATINKETVTP
jgi:hypothetical protein